MADVKEKVGVLTDEISTAGRPIYKTPEGEMVSEKSTTFKYKGGWINIPTIHNGYSYDEEELRIMLDNNIIKPTSTHKNLKAAEKAAKERSPTLRGFNPGGSVEGQTQKAFELNIPIPRAEEDPFEISYPSGTDRYGNVYFGGIQNKPDPFNPLQFAKSSWEDAKKKIMDAGVTETDANDPALYNGYLRAVDYFKDMGLGALDLVDAAAKAAIGTVAEIMPTEEKERRFERDIYSIPDAFMGTAGAKSLTQLDDAVDAAVAGTKQAGQKVKNIPKVFEPSEEYKQALAIEKKEQGINGYGLTTEEFSNPSTLIVPSPTKGVNIVNPTGDMKLPRINEEAMSELRSGVRAGTIEYVPIKDFLEFFPGNPLVRDTNKLLNDIETNGMTTPIQIGVGWQGHTAEIFEGNHRLDALIKGGYTHVPAMVDIMSDAGQGKLHSFFGDAIHGQATVGVRKKELPPQQKPSDVFRSFYRRLPQEVKKETFSEKANKAVSAIDTKLEDIFETVDTKYKQGPLGALERKLTKEQMGKSKGKQNPVQTQKALNLGYSETGYHSTKSFSPTEEIEVFKLPDEVARDQAASQGMTLKELIKYKGLGFNNPKKAHDFLGVHVGTTKAAADRFSDLSSYKGLSKMGGARTYELKLKTNKPFLDGKKPWTEKRLNNFLVKEMDKIKDGAVFEKMQIIRRQLAEQGFTHVPYVNEVEDKNNISYAMLVDRPEGNGVNSSAVIRYKDAEFNPLEKSNRNAKFAQGGVAMKDQMEMSFAIGGVAETVDPVSGNDVPPGSLPEEVRDDIPARLSEGEYVVPADVVRYYGVKFFEDLRTQAKMGLQQMDADGRIGGEPIDPRQTQLSEDDLNSIVEQAMQQEQPMMANKGGVVGYKEGGYEVPDYLSNIFVGGSLFDDNTSANQFYNADDYKPTAGEYTDKVLDAAKPVVKQPDPVCPPGQVYNKAKQMCVPKEESDGPPPGGGETTASTSFGKDKEGNFIDFTDPKAILDYAKSFDTPVLGGIIPDSETLQQVGVLGALSGIPAVGAVAGLASLGNKIGSTTDIAGLRAARISAAIYGHNDVVKEIESVIAGYEGGTGFTKGGKFGDNDKSNDAAKGLFGTGFNYVSSAHGINKKDLKTFMKMYDDPKADKEKLEKLREELEATSKAARQERVGTLSAQSRQSAKVEKKKREVAAENARKAAQAAASRRASQASTRYVASSGGGSDNGGGSISSIATQIQAQNPGLSKGEALSAAAKTKSYSSNTGGYDEAPDVAAGNVSGGKKEEDYGFGDAYNYKTGGLVQKRKKKK